MKNKVEFISFFLLLITFEINAQNYRRPEINLNDFITKLSSLPSNDMNYEQMFENIYSMYQKPINLNKADLDDLRSLFFLTELQINSLISHREKYGDYLSIYELQSVENMDLETIRFLLPFVEVQANIHLFDFNSEPTENSLITRIDETLQKSKGFAENKYLGSRQRIYSRYRYSHSKDYSFGFTSEKDAGEKNYFDFLSFYASIQNKGALKNLTIGDYKLQFGQGLIFSAGFALGKGSETVYNTRRSNLGIKPYNSILENNSFRGMAATYQIKNILFTGMISRTKKDASVDTTNNQFGSLLSSGYHRTVSELAAKDAVKAYDFGGNISYKTAQLQIGFSTIFTHFDTPFIKRDLSYNQFEFAGKTNLVAGPNLSFSWQNFNVFGEFAKSSSGGMGYIMGLVASLSAKTEWALSIRNYQANFHSFYASSFAEGGRTINEKGLYTGFKYIFNRKLAFATYFDSFSFPWLKYRVDAPSNGYDYQVILKYAKNKKSNLNLAFHHETKALNQINTISYTPNIMPTNRNIVSVSNDFYLHSKIRMQTKMQLNNYRIGSSNKVYGYGIFQDIETKIRKINLKSRLAYFKTDNYDTRIYAFENDVQYAVSFPMYYGNGVRTYLLIDYPLQNKLLLTLKISETHYLHQNTIGSGNDLINGTNKTDLLIQLRKQF